MSKAGWPFSVGHVIDGVLGMSMLGVVISLNYTWFSTPWSGSYEFYSGAEDAYGARGYPVEVAIRLILLMSLATLAVLIGTAAIRALRSDALLMSERIRRGVLCGLTICNLAVVLVALALPPRGMVAFPPIQLSRGAYIGLLLSSMAALSAGVARVNPSLSRSASTV